MHTGVAIALLWQNGQRVWLVLQCSMNRVPDLKIRTPFHHFIFQITMQAISQSKTGNHRQPHPSSAASARRWAHGTFYSSITTALVLFLSSAAGWADAIFTTSGTWTCPNGLSSVQVQCWGGGGAGGGVTVNSSSGGGGGGGAYSSNTISVTPGNIYTVTVGAGGAYTVTVPTSGSAGTGTNGGDSWFGSTSTILAKGGGGGANAIGNGGHGAGGSGGAAAAGVGAGCIFRW